MIGYLILAVLAAFIAVVAVRTIRFRPKPQPEVTKEEIAFDRDAAVDSLAQLVRCKTVSYNDHSLEDEGEFQKLISLLPTLYPNVFGTCTFQQLPDRALLLRWPGKQEGDPAVMMAHYDVVPVNEEKGDKPPFAGIIEDGILWGRGTLDTKVTFNGILSAANVERAAHNERNDQQGAAGTAGECRQFPHRPGLPAGKGHLLCLLRR